MYSKTVMIFLALLDPDGTTQRKSRRIYRSKEIYNNH